MSLTLRRTNTKVWIILSATILAVVGIILVTRAIQIPNAYATTWNQVFSDNFTRSNSATVGNGWIDTEGSSFSIASNKLVGRANGAVPINNELLRPTSENSINQRASIDFAGSAVGSDSQVWFSLRTQAAGVEYILGFNGKLVLGTYVSGSLNVLGSQVDPTTPIDSGHNYTLDARAENTSPTTLTLTLTDNTTSAVVGTNTITDSTSGLQTAGRPGLFVNSSTPDHLVIVDNFVYYNDSVLTPATSYTLGGPSTSFISEASSNYTVSPNGLYTGVITPSDSGNGGTFSPTSLSFSNSSTPQTFTYTAASIGSKTISTTSSPALTNPSSLPLNVTNSGKISVSNSNLNFSPYNWHFNGSTWAQTTPGGGYVKLAFTGSKLGINIDNSAATFNPGDIQVNAYVDGSTTPIVRTLNDAVGGLVTFSNSLGAGDHYATIYLSFVPCGCSERWQSGHVALRMTSIQLANDGSGNIRSQAGTPVEKKSQKILIYGDSITEGYGTSGAEYEYSGVLGRSLGVEYGQVGYRSGGWNITVDGAASYFYNIGDTAGSWYAGYDNAASRLVDPTNLALGFKDGTPDAIINNLGVNDYYGASGTSALTTKITAWLADARTEIGTLPAIIMVVPFDFGNAGNSAEQLYKTAYLAGVNNYISAHPSDHRIFVVDLGLSGYDIVRVNSADEVHPNDTGAALLAAAIKPYVVQYLSSVLVAGSVSVAVAPTDTMVTLASTAPTGGIAPYSYQWHRSVVPGFTPNGSTLISGATSNTLAETGLAPSTTYYYKVVYGDTTIPPQSMTSAQFSVTTTATPVTPPAGDGGTPTIEGSATTTTTATTTEETTTTETVPTDVTVEQVGGKIYSDGAIATVSEHPTIKGEAPANSRITITFHSDPVTCETNADAQGKWSCTPAQALAVGLHSVAIVAVTPDGRTINFPSFQIQVAQTATDAPTTDETVTDTPTDNTTGIWWIIGGVVVLVAIIGIIVAAVRSRK